MNFTLSENRMLAMYYAIRAITNDKEDRGRGILNALANVYCVRSSRAEELYLLSEREEIASILRYDDYLIGMRAIDFSERFGTPLELPEEIRFALTAKGKGLCAVRDLTFRFGNKPTVAEFTECVAKPKFANSVFIAAMTAFMYYEGIFLAKDADKASRFVETCLRWNSIDGALMALRYGKKEQKEAGLSVLYTVAEHADVLDSYASVFQTYREIPKKVSEEALLTAAYLDQCEKATEIFDPLVGKIVSSSFLSVGDRKRLLSLGDRNMLVQFDDLAFAESEKVAVTSLADLMVSAREKEADRIEWCLQNQKRNRLKAPLLVCRDKMSLRSYTAALEKRGGVVVTLSGERILPGAFSPSKANNVVIQNLIACNKKDVTFVITGVSELAEQDSDQLCAMLNPASRASFPLQDLGVHVDLSSCTFILFSETENASDDLLKECQTIVIEGSSSEEARRFAEDVIRESKNTYGCPYLEFHSDAVAYLAKSDVSAIETVIAKLCLEHGGEKEVCVLYTEDILKVGNGTGRQMGFLI